MKTNIDKNDWESIQVCGKWRFVDHKNKLLSFGWLDEFEMDIEKVKLCKDRINDMRETCYDYLG